MTNYYTTKNNEILELAKQDFVEDFDSFDFKLITGNNLKRDLFENLSEKTLKEIENRLMDFVRKNELEGSDEETRKHLKDNYDFSLSDRECHIEGIPNIDDLVVIYHNEDSNLIAFIDNNAHKEEYGWDLNDLDDKMKNNFINNMKKVVDDIKGGNLYMYTLYDKEGSDIDGGIDLPGSQLHNFFEDLEVDEHIGEFEDIDECLESLTLDNKILKAEERKTDNTINHKEREEVQR